MFFLKRSLNTFSLEKWIFFIPFLMLMLSCHSSTPKPAVKKPVSNKLAFQVPTIPLVLTTPEQRTDFLVEHYWDNFSFKDTSDLESSPIAEQAYTDYLNILLAIPVEKGVLGIKNLMSKAEDNARMFQFFLSLGEKYLYDPNSQYRSEPLYIPVLESFISSKTIESAYKIRPLKQLQLAQRNKVGGRAADFKFTLKNGSESNLYSLKNKFVLLYFHNPGCGECKKVREKIISSSLVQTLESNGTLKVLSVYPDADLAEWEKYYSELPRIWINAYDKSARIKSEDIYDLKAIPTLYLMGEGQIVLLKDARFEEIEVYLSNKL